jgi:hypothetical protein
MSGESFTAKPQNLCKEATGDCAEPGRHPVLV